ncbi:MAG: transposase [Acidimicrobiales bacterium]
MKEQLRLVFKLRGERGIALLKEWLAGACRSQIPAFVALAKSIRSYRKAIEAALTHGLTNARVESVNTKIRLLQRIAFGYRDPEALIADLNRLWNEPTTSPRDRKRILRTLINDVTLTSDPSGDEIRVGIRWRAGAHEEQLATRSRMLTNQDAVELIRQRKNEDMRDTDIAAELRASAYAQRAVTSSARETCATSDTRLV